MKLEYPMKPGWPLLAVEFSTKMYNSIIWCCIIDRNLNHILYYINLSFIQYLICPWRGYATSKHANLSETNTFDWNKICPIFGNQYRKLRQTDLAYATSLALNIMLNWTSNYSFHFRAINHKFTQHWASSVVISFVIIEIH